MKLISYILLLVITMFSVSCGGDEVNAIRQDFALKSNLEYGSTVKIGEELKIGIVVDSIDNDFEGSFITSININDPNNCSVTFNNKSLLSTDKLEHNYKASKTLWLQFKANQKGSYYVTAIVSNGVIAPKEIGIGITVTEYVYTIGLSCNESEGLVLGAGNYEKNANVSVEAKPKEGYQFEGWYQNGSKLTSNNPYIFKAVEDRHIEARFEKSIFKVEAEIEGEGEVLGLNSYPKGSNVVLEAKEKQYWQFAGYYNMNGVLLSTDKRYIISDLNENVKLKVKFIASVYVKFHLNFEGSVYYTTCSDNKRVVSEYSELKVQTFTYKNGQQQPYTFSSESLVITFDYGVQGVWYAWEKGERKWMCSYDVARTMDGTILTINKTNEQTHIHSPVAQYFMAHVNYLRNIRLSKSVTTDNRNIYLDPLVECKKDGVITQYAIPQ